MKNSIPCSGVHYPNHDVTKAKKEHVALPRDQPTWCPLVREYAPNIHSAVAQLRVLDGRIPVPSKHGEPVNCFAPAGAVKFWVKASTHAFGFFLYYMLDISESTRWSAHIWPISMECASFIQQQKKWLRSFWTLQWTCEYLAGVKRATRNETNLALAGSCYAVRPTQRLLKKYYLFNKKLLYLVDDIFLEYGL